MPLHSVEINHGYWKDKYGIERYFFDGSDMKSRNCKCSNDGECQGNPDALCYCDLRSDFGMQDKGRITADWLLPITEFGYKTFGRSLQNGFGKVTIGDIICTGKIVNYLASKKLWIFCFLLTIWNSVKLFDDSMDFVYILQNRT